MPLGLPDFSRCVMDHHIALISQGEQLAIYKAHDVLCGHSWVACIQPCLSWRKGWATQGRSPSTRKEPVNRELEPHQDADDHCDMHENTCWMCARHLFGHCVCNSFSLCSLCCLHVKTASCPCCTSFSLIIFARLTYIAENIYCIYPTQEKKWRIYFHSELLTHQMGARSNSMDIITSGKPIPFWSSQHPLVHIALSWLSQPWCWATPADHWAW